MRSFCQLSSYFLVAIWLILASTIFPSAAFAQRSSAGERAALPPRPLITQPVDEAQLTVLKGNTHRLARPEFDLGTAPATLPMQRMLLVLKRSPEQESALQKLLDDQQDRASSSYHKWLTPAEFGQQFGPTDADIQTITAWLRSHGFDVATVARGRNAIEFSGSASQVQEAFHTAIHKYLVNDEQHWANASDPSIPAALTPAVTGVLTLHNFVKKPLVHFSPQPAAARIVAGKKPQVTFTQNGQFIHALGPQDYATIYNINPVYNSNNSGANIAVVGRSNLFNGGSDVQNFRNVFGLCCGTFQILLNGADPGDLGGGEEAEATLDTTWSGAVAPQSRISLVVSATTNTTDGIDLSELYIIDNNLADVMTESFGTCEYFATDAEAAGVNNLAEQAAAQGISSFVSTGDEGAEGCDDPNFETVATGPISVNLLASSPFTTAVGGTMFNENGLDGKYWGVQPPVAESAISYIPEDVWNESCAAQACGAANASIWAGSGGASTGNILNGGTFPGFAKPSWQTGVTGIPADGSRDLPDVSLTSASHDPYLACLEGSCVPDSQGQFFIYFVWGTSAAAPSFAGVMSMVDSEAALQGAAFRQGAANYVLYRLAAAQNSNLAQCDASSTTSLPASTCVFNDVTVGNNAVPGEVNYGLSSALYQAGAGYDLATGLGSVNVANLVNQWTSVTFNATTTTLSLGASNITHGSPMPFSITVTPNGSGVPTGDAFLLAYTGFLGEMPTSVGFFTLSGGAVSSSTSALPGGNYSLTAHYGGDANFASSTSAGSSYITVSPENSTTTETVLAYDQNGNSLPLSNVPFGSFVYLRADVQGVSGQGTATGSVTFADTFGAIPGGSTFVLNSQGNTANPNGIAFDTGTHTLSASYTGDASFNPSSTSQPQVVSVVAGFSASVPSSGSQVLVSAPGTPANTSLIVATSTGFSGTISLSCLNLPSEASCTFTPASVTASGVFSQTTVGVAVITTAPVARLRSHPVRYFAAHWMAGLGIFCSLFLAGAKKRRMQSLLLLLMLSCLIAIPACGGSHSSSGPPPPPPNAGTPPGTYNVVINATSGAITSSTGFILFVQ